jgi:hypothetical protein
MSLREHRPMAVFETCRRAVRRHARNPEPSARCCGVNYIRPWVFRRIHDEPSAYAARCSGGAAARALRYATVCNAKATRPRAAMSSVRCRYHTSARRKYTAFPITDTELKLMAAAALIGDKSKQWNGRRGGKPESTLHVAELVAVLVSGSGWVSPFKCHSADRTAAGSGTNDLRVHWTHPLHLHHWIRRVRRTRERCALAGNAYAPCG